MTKNWTTELARPEQLMPHDLEDFGKTKISNSKYYEILAFVHLSQKGYEQGDMYWKMLENIIEFEDKDTQGEWADYCNEVSYNRNEYTPKQAVDFLVEKFDIEVLEN